MLRVWWARLVGAVTTSVDEDRLADEMHTHVEALAADFEARGLTRDEARRAAVRAFGSPLRVREAYRAQATFSWIDAVRQDVGHALRRMRSEPRFATAVVAALGVGIGGMVAVTGAVTAIGFAQPPFADPARVMAIGTIDDRGRRADVSWPQFEAWHDQARTLAGVAGFTAASFSVRADEGASERLEGAYVSASLFGLLGVGPERGRGFRVDDDRPGAASTALLGRATAEMLFGDADRSVGRVVRIDGVPTTVIGVMPRAMAFPLTGEIWRPLAQRPGAGGEDPGRRWLGAIGRLAPGQRPDRALEELAAIDAQRERAQGHRAGPAIRPTMTPFRERFLGSVTDPTPLALLTAAAAALLIGCATAATLMFARSTFRVDEMLMRVALGASRRRLLGQLVIESAVAAVGGGVVGLGLAAVALRILSQTMSGVGLPPWVDFSIDARVLALAVAATLTAAVFGGLAPAWQLSATAGTPGTGGARATATRPTERWMRALVAANVATTLTLIAVAAQLLSGAWMLWRDDRDLAKPGIVTVKIGLTGADLAEPATRAALVRGIRERLRGRGEIDAATITSAPPFGSAPMRPVEFDGPGVTSGLTVDARVVAIDSGYFAAVQLGPLEGRVFSDADRGDAAVLVNRAFAERFLSGRALDRRIRVTTSPTNAPASPWATVVGVVPSLRHSPRLDPEPAVYVPLAGNPPTTVTVMVRAAAGIPLATIVRTELQTLAPALAPYEWRTLLQLASVSRWTPRTLGGIVVALGTLALVLSALGIHAVTAYTAAHRTREASIRIAIGATPSAVTRLFVRATAAPVAAGLIGGLLCAWGASRAIRGMIFQGAAVGVSMIAPAALLLALVAGFAALAPARRVSRVDPIAALRSE